MKHIYLFSGLGVDHRAFQNINFTGFEITFITWIAPYNNESLRNYAVRLSKQITSNKAIFIGVSFGGMIALEIGKILKPEKIITISSVKTSDEMPLPFRIFGRLRLHYLIPFNFLKRSTSINHWLFGVSDTKNKSLLTDILRDTDPKFFKWAINAIALWRNKFIPSNTIHIHGTDDKILPHRFVRCDICVAHGGHFMIVDRADELNPILRNLLLQDVTDR